MYKSVRISASKQAGDKQSIRWRWWVVVVDDSGTSERMGEKKEKIDWLTSRANRLFLLILYVRTNRTIAITLSFLLLSFSTLSLSLSLCFSLAQVFTSYILNNNFLAYSSSPMDSNPLTPRASSFSIASLITSDCCDDENSLYHSLPSPIGTNHHVNILSLAPNPSVEKITSDYYPNHIQSDLHHFRSATLTETNNGQYQQQQQSTIKENRATNHKHHQVTNLQKSLTTIRNMEG